LYFKKCAYIWYIKTTQKLKNTKMKTLKTQLFETLLANGLNAKFEKSSDYYLEDDSIIVNNIDIQLGNGYVCVWNHLEDGKSKMLFDNTLNRKNFEIIAKYIVNLINSLK